LERSPKANVFGSPLVAPPDTSGSAKLLASPEPTGAVTAKWDTPSYTGNCRDYSQPATAVGGALRWLGWTIAA
jgi:hypothetical protein